MSEERKQALYQLIRELYREKQAGEIVESFEKVFADDSEDVEAVLDHWLDFYRLQKYRRSKVRRRPTYRERVTACSACGYPASHRHHLWDIAMHGENRVTIQLCANCHELHHLMYNALVRDSEYSRKLVLHVLFSGKISADTAEKILGWCLATVRYEANNGWIEQGRDLPAWVENQLHWTDFIKQQSAERG
ncbi:MAG: hypothetical protein IPK17_04265 [Chloroflexi bacterium]|uniref:hypothetical protein n=1 Tax=Candidatus Flexifilum breve TaxID=3140694 RepID=UPI0031350678|nr:hypothetical protein [Chloroflexota bacterium]